MVGGIRWMIVIFSVIVVMVRMVSCNIVLIGGNVSNSFDDIEATFTPTIKRTGECGVLYVAEPLDACSSLKNVAGASQFPFALIMRGVCPFDVKVKNAQDAGFKAAIVYDNEESSSLVAMAGEPVGIHIPAVFVSKSSGEELKQYEGRTDMELWIIPTYENSTWSIMAISFISLLAMSAVLATCFFVRRHRITRQQPLVQNVREFHGMSRRLVKAMPSLIFTSVLEDNCTSQTCAICLEDYSVGDKLRILPCCHKFHALCVDSWLTSWRTFCPVCKRDARTSTGEPPASESTPLLSSAASTPFSSFHSSLQSSHAIQILPPIPRSTSNSQRSYNNSPSISINRRSAGHPSSSPINSQYISNHITSSSNASPGYLVGSSSRYSYLRNCGMSGSPSYAIGSSSRYSYLRDCTEPGSLNYGGSSYLGSSSRHHYLRTCNDSSSPSHIVGSSSRNSYLRHCNESRESISALSSAQSLPGC